MPSFESLPTNDRWALAFYAGHFAFPDAAAAEGERLWKQEGSLRRLIPDLKTLVATTPAALAVKIGQDKADALTAYLRRHPEAVTSTIGRKAFSQAAANHRQRTGLLHDRLRMAPQIGRESVSLVLANLDR